MKDWQYTNLPIGSENVVATFAYCVIRFFNRGIFTQTDLKLTEGTAWFRLMWHQTPSVMFASEEQLCLAISRTLATYDFHEGMNVEASHPTHMAADSIARHMAHLLWKDACAAKRIEEHEAQRPWWERLWDWAH
jgi:hypothetical protein